MALNDHKLFLLTGLLIGPLAIPAFVVPSLVYACRHKDDSYPEIRADTLKQSAIWTTWGVLVAAWLIV